MGSDTLTKNAIRLRSILVEKPEAADDEKFLKYDHDTGQIVWAAAGSSDSDAIHDNVDGEISAIVAEKTALVDGDLLLLEDSENSYSKAKIQLSNLNDIIPNTAAQWNADKIQSVAADAPASGDDGEFLMYNYNGGSPTLSWEAAGGGTDLTGLGTDLRIPRWNGTDTLDYSTLSISDTTGDLTNTYTNGGWTITQSNVSSGSGNDLIVQAQGTTDTSAEVGGDLILRSGVTTYAGLHQGSAIQLNAYGNSGTEVEVAAFQAYADYNGVEHKAITKFYKHGDTNSWLGIQFDNHPIIGRYGAGTFYNNIQFGTNYMTIYNSMYAYGAKNIGASNLYAFTNGYFDNTLYLGTTDFGTDNWLQLSNTAIKQNDVSTGAGQDLTITGSDTGDSSDGGDISLVPGTSTGGTDGVIKATRFAPVDVDSTSTVGSQNNRFPVYAADGSLIGYVPIYDAS